MTLQSQLSPEMAAQLKIAAAERQMSVDDLVLDLTVKYLLEKGNGASGDSMPKTVAEVVAYLERHGVIGAWENREDITDGPSFARELRRRAWTREW